MAALANSQRGCNERLQITTSTSDGDDQEVFHVGHRSFWFDSGAIARTRDFLRILPYSLAGLSQSDCTARPTSACLERVLGNRRSARPPRAPHPPGAAGPDGPA